MRDPIPGAPPRAGTERPGRRDPRYAAGAVHALSDLLSSDTLASIASAVLREVLAAQLGALILAGVLWGALGLLAGLLLAGVGLRLLRMTGLHELRGQGGRWLPRLRLGLTIAVVAVAVAGLGAVEGPRRALPDAIKRSQIGTRLFPPIGETGATLMMIAPPALRAWRATRQGDPRLVARSAFATVMATRGELDVPAFFTEMNDVSVEFVAALAAGAKVKLLEEHPALKTALGERLLEVMLPRLLVSTLSRTVKEKSQALDLGDLEGELRAAAARTGAPDTITHAELSTFLVDRVLVPPVMMPANHLLRSLQLTCLLLFVAGLLLPSLLARLGAWALARRAQGQGRAEPPSVEAAPASLGRRD
jgi:hypothetical protein